MVRSTLRVLLIVAGCLFVALGVLGIFLPLLPTTVFILLAAFCFARSSETFHTWLIEHKHFGELIENFQSGKGIPRLVRIRAVIVLWLSMAVSMWVVAELWLIILLAVIGTCVTIYLCRLPTASED